MSRSRFLHVVSYASGLILPSAVAAAWWYRPVVDPGAFCKGNTVDCKSGPVREGMISRYTLSDYADQSEPVLFRIASRIAIFTTVCAARAFMTLAGQFAIKDDENYAYFLQQTVARKEGVPLITVSNHRSLLDEPTIFASLLPFWLNVQPKFLRYSLCAQEYCFYEKVLFL